MTAKFPIPTVDRKVRPYQGITIISDGSCLNSTHHAALQEHLPGIHVRIINYLRLEDVPGALAQISPARRQTVVIFVGSRDVFGAPEIHYRLTDKPNRNSVSYSHQTIHRGLLVLQGSMLTPTGRTYLYTVPHRAPFTPTSDRLYLNAVNCFQASVYKNYPHSQLRFFPPSAVF